MNNLLQDAHPILVHFPIALLILGILLSYATRWKPEWLETTWILMLVGGLATLPATISGLIAHFPYEATELHDVIESHQLLGFVTTLLFVALTIWRWQSRRSGRDIGASMPYLAVLTVGLVLLFFLGETGGDLVYEYGINVRGINPLLNQQ